MSLLADTTSCDTGLKYTKAELGYSDTAMATPTHEEIRDDDGDDDSTVQPIIVLNEDTQDFYKWAYTRSKQFSNSDFDLPSNTKRNGVFMTYNEIFEAVNAATNVPIKTLQTLAVIESTIGKDKLGAGNKNTVAKGNDGMNYKGYVGLMQFGRKATLDVKSRIEAVTFTPANSDIEFFGASTTTQQKILMPSTWSSTDNTVNNKETNSMFDDYISAMGSAYYAIQNTGLAPIDITGDSDGDGQGDGLVLTDAYLAHQQGKSGLGIVKSNPLNKVVTRTSLTGNTPPYDRVNVPMDDSGKGYTFEQWYQGWNGWTTAIFDKIEPSHVSTYDPFANANKLRKVLHELGYVERKKPEHDLSELTSSGKDISTEIEKFASALFKRIKAAHPEVKIEVTGGNDHSHSMSSSSRHAKGNAIDFIVFQNQNDNSKVRHTNHPYLKRNSSKPPKHNTYRTDNGDKALLDSIKAIIQGFQAGPDKPKPGYLDEYTLGSTSAGGAHYHISWHPTGGTEGSSERAESYSALSSGLITAYSV